MHHAREDARRRHFLTKATSPNESRLDAGLAAESLPALLSFRPDLELAAAELAAGRLAFG